MRPKSRSCERRPTSLAGAKVQWTSYFDQGGAVAARSDCVEGGAPSLRGGQEKICRRLKLALLVFSPRALRMAQVSLGSLAYERNT